jgi:hypothetical protein
MNIDETLVERTMLKILKLDHTRIKVQASKEGTTIINMVSKMVDEYLKSHKED